MSLTINKIALEIMQAASSCVLRSANIELFDWLFLAEMKSSFLGICKYAFDTGKLTRANMS